MKNLNETRSQAQIEMLPPGASTHPETGPELRPDFRADTQVSVVDAIGADVDSARGQIQVLISMLWQIVGVRGAVTCARQAKAALRRLYTREKEAVILIAKQALRRNPDWQAQVLEDLGGEAAAQRWRARLLKSYDVQPEDDYAWLDDDPGDWPMPELRKRPPARQRELGRSRFKTDRNGLFRWAAIQMGRRSARRRHGYETDWNNAHDAPTKTWRGGQGANPKREEHSPFPDIFPDIWPIEVLPMDLSSEAVEEDIIKAGIDPQELWTALQAEHRYWHGQIVSFLQNHKHAIMGARLVPP